MQVRAIIYPFHLSSFDARLTAQCPPCLSVCLSLRYDVHLSTYWWCCWAAATAAARCEAAATAAAAAAAAAACCWQVAIPCGCATEADVATEVTPDLSSAGGVAVAEGGGGGAAAWCGGPAVRTKFIIASISLRPSVYSAHNSSLTLALLSTMMTIAARKEGSPVAVGGS